MNTLLEQMKIVCPPTDHVISALSNASRLIYDAFKNINWSGFYLADTKGDLYLGPYQGPLACSFIELDHGVCGSSAKQKQTIVVPDVTKCPKHIACSSDTKSEIVVPIINDDIVVGVIDIDSYELNNFTKEDRTKLEECAEYLKQFFNHYNFDINNTKVNN